MFMGGGISDDAGIQLLSIGMFQTPDGGETWSRPACTPPMSQGGECRNAYNDNSYLLADAPSTVSWQLQAAMVQRDD